MIGADALAELIAPLLVVIAGYTGYALPGTPPVVTFVPHAVLEARACRRPCAVLGFTAPDGTILLDDRLAVDTEPADTSILIHELTHYLQRAGTTDEGPVTCATWIEREHEAYDVQYRWLRETAANIRDLSLRMARLRRDPVMLPCRPAPSTRGEVGKGWPPQPDVVPKYNSTGRQKAHDTAR